jgi:uncharacterized protein
VTVLLDANVLIALVVADHVHHDSAESWLTRTAENFATCPITLGSLVRLLIREGQSADTVARVLAGTVDDARHEFWPDSVSFTEVALAGIVGHRQVTDAYLAQLTRARRGRLATFDRGLASLHPDIAELVPVVAG